MRRGSGHPSELFYSDRDHKHHHRAGITMNVISNGILALLRFFPLKVTVVLPHLSFSTFLSLLVRCANISAMQPMFQVLGTFTFRGWTCIPHIEALLEILRRRGGKEVHNLGLYRYHVVPVFCLDIIDIACI